MELQPEDVRVPSGDSSPTQAPLDDTLSHQEHSDPALLSSIPRSENQYNEDFTDYARQVHNSTHGEWPVAEPYEEWACRRCHNERYWFYRAWFHHKTLPWDHEDIGPLGTTNPRPATLLMITPPLTGLRFSHECGAPGAGNLCFLLPPALRFGHNANDLKPLFVLKKNALLLKKHVLRLSNNSVTRQLPAEAKRDRLWTIWSISTSSTKSEALLRNFSQLDVSKVPMLQGLPPPQQEQLITGVVHTLTTYRDELHQSCRPDDPPGHSTAIFFGPS